MRNPALFKSHPNNLNLPPKMARDHYTLNDIFTIESRFTQYVYFYNEI